MASGSPLRGNHEYDCAGSSTNQLINWLKLSQTDLLSAHQVRQSPHRYQIDLINGLLLADVADGLTSAFIHDLEHLAALLDSGLTPAIFFMRSAAHSRKLMKAHPIPYCGRSWHSIQANRLWSPALLAATRRAKPYNGSDYLARQIGALGDVSCVTIWSDVASVYSADARKVKNACLLPLLCLDEASKLARLAAPVLHTCTLQPVAAISICHSAAAITRRRARHALNEYSPPALDRVSAPAMMMAA